MDCAESDQESKQVRLMLAEWGELDAYKELAGSDWASTADVTPELDTDLVVLR